MTNLTCRLQASLLYEALQSVCVQARYIEAGTNDAKLRELAAEIQQLLDEPRARLHDYSNPERQPSLATVDGKRT